MPAAASLRHSLQYFGAWQILLVLSMSSPCEVSCQPVLPVLRIGIDANTWGFQVTADPYKDTFDYLTEQLRLQLLCTFETVLFHGADDFTLAALNRSVDIFLAGPGIFVCLQITMSGISTLTSGQSQWRELHAQGFNPLVLASQVIFIPNQAAQVSAVLNNQADVAFVRADQLSRLANSSMVKVLSPVSSSMHSFVRANHLHAVHMLQLHICYCC
ncbi:hypothetical protein ABBQ32_14207 [Trebouxia sp. C0010 RCD-2024]